MSEKKEIDLQQLINDSEFINIISQIVTEINQKRRDKPPLKPGFYYKRDWHDRMTEAGIFKTSFIRDNIISVLTKKSKLNHEQRKIIESIFFDAFRRYNENYLHLSKK